MSTEQNSQAKPKQSISSQLAAFAKTLGRYTTLWFALLLAIVYGFVLYRIQTAQSAQPTDSERSSQIQSTVTPHVNQDVVDQMQSLQDHSVNVRTLFDQARSNPFNE